MSLNHCFPHKGLYPLAITEISNKNFLGCDGNSNRFDTEQECRNTCGDFRGIRKYNFSKNKLFYKKDACLLPSVSGPCAGKADRYYFDFHSNKCSLFQYGGCLG